MKVVLTVLPCLVGVENANGLKEAIGGSADGRESNTGASAEAWSSLVSKMTGMIKLLTACGPFGKLPWMETIENKNPVLSKGISTDLGSPCSLPNVEKVSKEMRRFCECSQGIDDRLENEHTGSRAGRRDISCSGRELE